MKKIALILLTALVSVGTIEAKKMSELTVVIDPGHGGYDGDDRGLDIYPYCAVVEEGYWESKSNLVKGLHLQNILDSLGVDVHLTRVHNVYNEIEGDNIPDEPSLATRAYMANDLGADCFISIHSNAGENVNYPLMIYHLLTNMTPRSTESVRLAEVVNDVFNTSKYSNWVDYKGQINTETPGRVTGDRALLGYSLGVLRNCYVTSMLSEGGMHEHRPQAHRLMNNDYNWLEAWYFAKAIMIYFDTEDRFVTGNVAGVVYDDHNIRELEYTGKYVRHTMLGRDKNLPINGAYVELLDAAGNVVQYRTTDKDYNGVFVFRNLTPGEYTIKVTHDKYYSSTQKVTVTADEVTYQDMPLMMKREMPLQVVSYSPNVAITDSVGSGEIVTINFNTDIDVAAFENAFKIEPAVEGYFEYHNSYNTVTFTPTVSFDLATKYTVTIDKSACTPDTLYANNTMAEDVVFSFVTQNVSLDLLDTYPHDGGTIHYDAPALEFRFNREIDYSNIADMVKVYDSQNNVLAMNTRSSKYNQLSNGYGNAVIILSKDLTVGESYRIVMSGELRDKTNLPLATDVEISFVAGDMGTTKEGDVLETLEAAGLFAYDVNATVGITTTTPKYIASTTRLFDSKSGKFSYSFASNREGIVVWNYVAPDTVARQVAKGDVVGIHVYGDFNNHELYLGVTSGTDTKYEKICDLNFRGWEYFEVPMNSLEEGYNYNLSNIKLVQTTSPITQNGSFQIDQILVQRNPSNGIEGIVADEDAADVIKIYPVPAHDVINVDAPAQVKSLEMYNICGEKVASVNDSNAISVEELGQGVYLLRVVTTEGSTVHRVAVSK